jgi:soluble lytic murein transglycosylase
MSNTLLAIVLTAGAVALGVPVIMLSDPAAPGDERRVVEGDVAELIAEMDSEDIPARAQAFLATDRPWRAARVMRSYLAVHATVPAEHRLLAARAEAGWGAWPEALALLEDVPALDTHAHGIGLYLLARARDEAGDAAGAAEAYRAFLALSAPAGELMAERAAARLRLGLALLRTGDHAVARRELAAAEAQAGGARVWLELLEADALAHVGDTAAVREAVATHSDGVPGLRAWRARIEAARRSGDLAGARALANQARAWARTDATRSEFLVTAARAAIEMGDDAAGRAALRGAIDRGAAGPHARAAAALLREGAMSPADHLAVARVYRAQGLHVEAIDGYRRWLASRSGTAAERNAVHLEHANALFYAHRYEDVAEALRPIATQTSARFLHARAEAHSDNPDDAVRIYLGVANQFPRSGTAAQALYLAASARHDAGDARGARELYTRVLREHAGSGQMGLSMMRLAGIAFADGAYAEAARLWDDYRTRYPRGANVLQATYWSGRARAAMGDSTAAAALYRTVLQRERDSYYALLASEELGQPYWPLPMVAAPGENPAASRRVADWVRGIDLLRTAGFHDEASAEVDRVVATAGTDAPTLYALAEALAERGYAQRAIRLGVQLQRTGQPNRRLLRILYPFPYRALITEEARDRGLDPFVVAALIRQESMFEARITSPAGARGLMQIMPATGAGLADAVGIDRWDAGTLYHPEINVHLGTRYLARHMENYDGSLPGVFSAYNAGSHRVAWWSQWPEWGNDRLFTERIPFAETRNYVRILSRNLAVYRGLYGQDG